MADIPDIRQNVQADFTINDELDVTLHAQPNEDEVVVEVNGEPAEAHVDVSDVSAVFDLVVQQPPVVDAEFGVVYQVPGECKVLCATTATWNSQPQLISKKGYIYIYSDYRRDSQGNVLAAMKVGDGATWLIDMAFIDEMYADHIQDTIIHITQEERNKWNNKVTCYMEDETLIFTKD